MFRPGVCSIATDAGLLQQMRESGRCSCAAQWEVAIGVEGHEGAVRGGTGEEVQVHVHCDVITFVLINVVDNSCCV